MTEKTPSMFQPIMLTTVALLDLVAAFYMVAGNPKLSILSSFLVAEVGLTVIAIGSWVKYFKSYVRYEIEHRLEDSAKNRS